MAKDWIMGISSGTTNWSSISCFQLFGFPVSKLFTVIMGWNTGAMGLAGLNGVVGSQRFSHTLISFPEWTFFLIPSKINGFAAIMLVQPYDGHEHLFSLKASYTSVLVLLRNLGIGPIATIVSLVMPGWTHESSWTLVHHPP